MYVLMTHVCRISSFLLTLQYRVVNKMITHSHTVRN